MSRWRIGLGLAAVLVTGLCAQENKPAPALPATKEQKPPSQTPDPEQLPPEEDASIVKQDYSFNPVRSRRDVEVGNFYFKKGDWKAAAGRFREATLWNEGNAEAWLRWGETEEKARRHIKRQSGLPEVSGSCTGREERRRDQAQNRKAEISLRR